MAFESRLEHFYVALRAYSALFKNEIYQLVAGVCKIIYKYKL